MRLRCLVSFLLSACLCAALPAAAGLVPGACSGRLLKWECVGLLTMTSTRHGETETLRLHFHDDDTTLVEVSRPAGIQRMLVTPDAVWFQGVPPDQPPGRNPFLDLPEGALLPIHLLGLAFPDGPDTVPEQETVRELALGRERIGVSAARAIDGTIRFTITERGQTLAQGSYRAGELAPPAGGVDLTRWTRGERPRRLIERRD